MKPFDLEAAKRGEPIQYRDGVEVKFIAHVPEAHHSAKVIVLSPAGFISIRNEKGRIGTIDNPIDLMMAPKKITYWVNIYKNEYGPLKHCAGTLITSEEIANKLAKDNQHCVKTISFELEE